MLQYESGIGLDAPDGTPNNKCYNQKNISTNGTTRIRFFDPDIILQIELSHNNYKRSVAFAPFFIPIIPWVSGISDVREHQYILEQKAITRISFTSMRRSYIFNNKEKSLQAKKNLEKMTLKSNSIYILKDGVKHLPELYSDGQGKQTRNNLVYKASEYPIMHYDFNLSPDELIGTELIFEGLIKDNKYFAPSRRVIKIKKSEGYIFSAVIVNC